MSVMKYKFVSPGVFIEEIDRSRIPAGTPQRGPVIIGRTERGPGMRPTQVNSFSEYQEIFGDTVPGVGRGDVWRDGNYASPMYATYAAQAWLKNGQTATIIRLLGHDHTDKTSGNAGWGGFSMNNDGVGGTYGLFLIDSGTQGGKSTSLESITGTLAAVWHMPDSDDAGYAIVLSGAVAGPDGAHTAATASNGMLLKSSADNWGFKAVIQSGSGATPVSTHRFDFDANSPRFIRKVFNTNPIFTNTSDTVAGNREKYWLASSFERAIPETLTSSSAGTVHGVMLRLGGTDITGDTGYAKEFSDFALDAVAARSNWIISQDTRATGTGDFDAAVAPTYVKKLFQFHARDAGDWVPRNLKISIRDIKQSPNPEVDPFGSFAVQIRRAKDTDQATQIVEQYNNCNLNPNSPNYIARKIGDQYSVWDDNGRRFRDYGEYPNISKFVRVEVNETALAANPELVPFGFWGPLRPKMFTVMSGAAAPTNQKANFLVKTFATSSHMFGAVDCNNSGGFSFGLARDSTAAVGQQYGACGSASFIYPTIAFRSSSAENILPNDQAAYFGYDSRKRNSQDFDYSNYDLLKVLPGNVTDSSLVEYPAFTLDDVKVDNALVGTYVSGSRRAGTSATAISSSYTRILDDGFNKFTLPMFGGFDGFDVTKLDPLANQHMTSGTEKTNYVYNTYRRAIESCADPERVDFNLMVVPGMTNTSLTDLMVNVCEERGDALAIIDLPGVYNSPAEGQANVDFAQRVSQKLSQTVSDFKSRKMNSSYGCAYYPWVQIRDSLNNAPVWVPPSVVALGTFASSDRFGEIWFAPAGFNRGGLTQGSAGLTVTGISEKLSSDQRDDLYEVNINPIASFPNEGLVVFGQKTLDATTSALSRINVRRLLIFLKKEVSRLARQVLFDNNVRSTWGRFEGLVKPLLEDVKVRFGLTDYRLVLDETTTTPDLIDRNIMYAKIFLKPARAIEFIALDFIITRTGASFED